MSDSSTMEKLVELNSKIKQLTTSTSEFKDKIKQSIIDLKPKIATIARKAKSCSLNDTDAETKRKELEKLLADKDALLKDYIKKDDLEKEGYVQMDNINEKISTALTDLEKLIADSSSGNKEIETLIEDIETQLSDVEKELIGTSTEKMDENKEKESTGDKNIDNELADLFDDGDDSDEEPISGGGKKTKRRKRKHSRKRRSTRKQKKGKKSKK
jgi:hypothetical protein